MADISKKKNKTTGFEEELKPISPQANRSCPHLGIQLDPKSYYNFPSEGHRCFYTQPPGLPIESHQAQFCLSNSYDKCPVFNQLEGQRMPPELSKEKSSLWQSKKIYYLLAGLILALLLIIIIPSFFRKGSSMEESQLENPTVTSTTSQTIQQTTAGLTTIGVDDEDTSTATPTPNIPAATATLVLTPTKTFTPTITLTPTSTHGLDVVIGETYKYVIHRTGDGESVQMYADLYNTTPQAIYDSNYLMPVPIWINWLIIIPVDMADTSDLPAFEAYMVEKDAVRLDLLADELDVKLRDLMLYNNLEVDHILNYGDWILIPRERPEFTN